MVKIIQIIHSIIPIFGYTTMAAGWTLLFYNRSRLFSRDSLDPAWEIPIDIFDVSSSANENSWTSALRPIVAEVSLPFLRLGENIRRDTTGDFSSESDRPDDSNGAAKVLQRFAKFWLVGPVVSLQIWNNTQHASRLRILYIDSAYLARRKKRNEDSFWQNVSDSIELPYISASTSLGKEKSDDTPCIDDNKFYRNPNAPTRNVWSPAECAKYYLCLGNSLYHRAYVRFI